MDVTIRGTNARSRMTRVDGIVDLPQAYLFFQRVGAPNGVQRQAPPDNVIFGPGGAWHTAYDAPHGFRSDVLPFQAHVRLDHALPHDPAAAFNTVSGAARHLEVALSGAGVVGDNLAATLDAARSDATYAQVL